MCGILKNVATHTSWKIEPAYHFIGEAPEQHGSDKECDEVPADNAPEHESRTLQQAESSGHAG